MAPRTDGRFHDMQDSGIRQELDALLRRQHAGDPGAIIRHEMGLCAGRRRIDLAVLNYEISGYEIKSDEDTLLRLPGQAHDYGRVLDRVTLVTTAKHQEQATALIPEWWGIIAARQQGERIVLETVGSRS